eukprot:6208359-Pleurochrysis_carterae.AAC.4
MEPENAFFDMGLILIFKLLYAASNLSFDIKQHHLCGNIINVSKRYSEAEAFQLQEVGSADVVIVRRCWLHQCCLSCDPLVQSTYNDVLRLAVNIVGMPSKDPRQRSQSEQPRATFQHAGEPELPPGNSRIARTHEYHTCVRAQRREVDPSLPTSPLVRIERRDPPPESP